MEETKCETLFTDGQIAKIGSGGGGGSSVMMTLACGHHSRTDDTLRLAPAVYNHCRFCNTCQLAQTEPLHIVSRPRQTGDNNSLTPHEYYPKSSTNGS